MAFVFQMENIHGFCIEFLEPEDGDMRSAMRMRPYGKEVVGTLALQTFTDRPYKRITFSDTKNVNKAYIKDMIGYIGLSWAKNIISAIFKAGKIAKRNDLCHFDFSNDDLRTRRKLLRIEMQGVICTLCCYDFTTHLGTCYLLMGDAVNKWAKVLGINSITVLNQDGSFAEKIEIK